jgi:hypothetical protein
MAGIPVSTLTILAGYRRALSLLVIVALTSCVGLLLAQPALAASAPTPPSWAVSNDQAGATAVDYSFLSTTETTAVIKTITVTVSGARLAGTPAVVLVYGIGAGAVTINGPVITYSVTDPVAIDAGIPLFLEFSGLTNPAAGGYTATIATETADGMTVGGGTTAVVTFGAHSTAKSVVVEPGLTFTITTTPAAPTRDPTFPTLVDQSYTTTITVLTSANSGYTLTVARRVPASVTPEAAWPGGPAIGTVYTVSGTGPGDAGFSVSGVFAGGTRYVGEPSAATVVAHSTTATGAAANTIAVTYWTAHVPAGLAGIFTDVLSYTLTPDYS